MKTYELCRAMASAAAAAAKATAAGVVVSVEIYDGDRYFVIWSINVLGKLESHKLDCECTDGARLEAHVKGFVFNHLASFAAHEQAKMAAARQAAGAAFAGWAS